MKFSIDKVQIYLIFLLPTAIATNAMNVRTKHRESLGRKNGSSVSVCKAIWEKSDFLGI